MVRIAIDAGHAMTTPGKQTPNGEKEWYFNDIVVRWVIAFLKKYDNVEVLRLDDPRGRIDVPLNERTKKANDWKADALVSVHHNALSGQWGTHTGTETYFYPGSKKGQKLAESVHPEIVKRFGLKDRGIKQQNFHMLRESNMPAILTEGGYMDSKIDIVNMRNETKLRAQAEGIAFGLAKHFGLKKKATPVVEQPQATKFQESEDMLKPSIGILNNAIQKQLSDQVAAGLFEKKWLDEYKQGKLSVSDFVALQVIAEQRNKAYEKTKGSSE